MNNKQMGAGMKKHGDIIMAAKETWSGRLLTFLGFSELSEEDIKWDDRDSNAFLSVVFRKPA